MEQMNNKNLPEFLMAFQISKLIIFEVEYYTLSTNSKAHFTTGACEFIRSKRDYSCCGQAQDHLLPQGSKAREFWEKWDVRRKRGCRVFLLRKPRRSRGGYRRRQRRRKVLEKHLWRWATPPCSGTCRRVWY